MATLEKKIEKIQNAPDDDMADLKASYAEAKERYKEVVQLLNDVFREPQEKKESEESISNAKDIINEEIACSKKLMKKERRNSMLQVNANKI